ncbi:putative bifunctional diguanylate cyclase/phosphodiesterase [Mycobacterium sp. RTGN5]|uniref:putative bifunctional diguanylate cyclase/phosphodiesterase n=1 Tax=Mycobacterium sp. RTGN5 TaxID=3016522 RepID=UPI0029C9276B|nr:EAL domain-containing protein [Mycobacterium sp. RTGN5]
MKGITTATHDTELVRVLLVEDNDGDARLVQLMLEGTFGSGMELARARSLREAMAELDVEMRDCVVLDLGLPDASGLEGVRAIKHRSPMMPVVVLTGHADSELGMQAVAAGAQDYLVKGNAVDETLTRAIRYAVLRKHAEDALVRSQATLAEAQRIAHLGSWELNLVTDEMVWSEELRRLYGYAPDTPRDMDDLLGQLHPEDAESVRGLLHAALDARSAFDVDYRIVLPDGVTRWLRSQGRVELDGASVAFHMRGTVQDITEQRSAEDALAHQALHDPLTGLPNRTLLLDRLTHMLGRLDRSDGSVGVLFIDIDRFKVINDSLGHPAGDHMLLAMASRLRTTLRTSDTLARFGGDEFVVLCEGLTGEEEAIGIAASIRDAMQQPLGWGKGELVVTLSIGIAMASSPLVSAESLLRDADAAMYRAKQDGRARSAVFAHSMRAKAVERLDTEVALRRSIAAGEFEIQYQPIVELRTRRIVGSEALVRWRHPSRGLVPPGQFIPIAEETGLIVPLGAWVLREAATQAAAWRARSGLESFKMAVNLSPLQVADAGLVRLVAEVIAGSGLPPECLELEITETALMEDAAAAVQILGSLKGLGVSLSIDDFGTGYSSLSYLKRFPVDTLKIDQSFVADLSDSNDDAIIKAVISLASALNLETIAEGVETAGSASRLLELGCGFAQGFYFARPAAAGTIDDLLDIA